MKIPTRFGMPLLRLALVVVFLYFGFSQLLHPSQFIGYLPPEASLIPLQPTTMILLNGILEVALGLLLALGVYTRASALILGVHLLVIALTMGFTQTAVRDFGLALATLSLFLSTPDEFCLDVVLENRAKSPQSS